MQLNKEKRWIVVTIIILIVLLVIKLGSSDSSEEITQIDEVVYSVSSNTDEISGSIKVNILTDGRATINFAFIIEDSSLLNNGVCIDYEGEWCVDESHHRTEEVKYQYMPRFIGEIESEDVHAGWLQALYCNIEEIKADPFDTTIDKFCGYTTVNWVPTSTFIITGITTYDSLEEFLSINQLDLYDTSQMHRISYIYEEEKYTGTLSEENLTYEEIVNKGEVIKSYNLELKEL